MTGRPAETWRTFRFRSPAPWSPAFILLFAVGIGFLISGALIYITSPHASGRMPVTREAAARLSRLIWISVMLMAGAVVAAFVGVLTLSSTNLAIQLSGPLLLFMIAPFAFIAGSLGVQMGLGVAFNPIGPRGKVFRRKVKDHDRIVELYHLHPAFVSATSSMYAARSVPQARLSK